MFFKDETKETIILAAKIVALYAVTLSLTLLVSNSL